MDSSALDAVPITFLSVSMVALVMQAASLARILDRRDNSDARSRGLTRTAICRVGASALYVTLGVSALLVPSDVVGVLALACFTATSLIWISNGIADARLAQGKSAQSRRGRHRKHLGTPRRGPLTTEDPLHGAGSNLPPVPPTAPPPIVVNPGLSGAAQSRHAMGERLAGPHGEPIVPEPEAGPSPPVLASRIAAVDAQHKMSITFVWIGISALFALILLVGYLDHQSRARVGDLAARQVAASVEQARISGQARNAICLAIQSWRATYSTPGRDAYPGGGGRYDALYKGLAEASGAANCDAG